MTRSGIDSPRSPAEPPGPAGEPLSGATAAALPRWRAFPALALGVVMATLDISVVNIALPTLSRVFRAPLTTIEWVVLAYLLTITGLLLTLGRLADARGRRRVYGAGLLVFTSASALCGAAPDAGWLIAARTLQGLGAAMMSANSSALLIASFPAEERGRALGAFGAMVGVGLAVGTPLGGLIVGHLSWRWLFFVNLPIGALAFWLLVTRVPKDPPPHAPLRLHAGAAAAWLAALCALLLGLSRGPALGWGHPGAWPCFPAAAALLAAFVLLERRAAEPLLPLRLVRGPLGVAVSLTLIANALSIAVGFHLPLYLEDVLGFDAAASGRWMATLPVSAVLAAPLAGRLSDRLGTRPLAIVGMAITAAGFFWLSGVATQPRPGHILGGMALIGVGLGLFTVPNASALLSLVPHDLLGLASGLQATMRYLGSAGGSAAMAALVATRYAWHGGGTLMAGRTHLASRQAFSLATHDAYLVLGAVAALATVLAWTQPAPAPHGTSVHEAGAIRAPAA